MDLKEKRKNIVSIKNFYAIARKVKMNITWDYTARKPTKIPRCKGINFAVGLCQCGVVIMCISLDLI